MEELFTQFQSLIKGVWKYRWYAMITTWVVAICGWIIVLKMPDNYQSSARVFVDTQSILKPLLSGMTSVPNIDQQVSIMSRTLLSRPNLERVIRMVDLDIKTKTDKDKEEWVDKLLSEIKIVGTVQNDIYSITYNNENPRLVKEVVQALLTIFVEGSIGDKKQDSAKAIQFIDDQIKNYEEKLIKAENELKEFKVKNIGLLPRQGNDYSSKLFEANESLSQAILELREAEQARNAIKKQIENNGVVDGAHVATISPELENRIQTLNKNLDALRLQYTEQHPDIVSTKRLLAQLEARVKEEASMKKPIGDPGLNYSPMLQQLKVSLSAAEARVASMRARVNEYASRNAKLKDLSIAAPEVEKQFVQLNRDYQIDKANYDKMVANRESAKLSGDLSATTEMMTFRVIDPPTVPLKPVGPNRLRLGSFVFVVALLAGIGIAALLSKIRPTFVSTYNLREMTGLPILGSVAMNWTNAEQERQKKGLLIFILSFIVLIAFYSAWMAFLFWHS